MTRGLPRATPVQQRLQKLQDVLDSPLREPLLDVLTDRLSEALSALVCAQGSQIQILQGRAQELQYLIKFINTGK